MMPDTTTCRPQARRWALRKPMNTRSLQMMVASGVVRRADWNFSLVPNQRVLDVPAVTHMIEPHDTSLTQGWLVRLWGRRKRPAFTHQGKGR